MFFLDSIPKPLAEVLTKEFAGNPTISYVWALLAAILCFFIVKIISKIGMTQFMHFAKKTKAEWDDFAIDLLRNNTNWLSFIIALYTGTFFLEKNTVLNQRIDTLFIILASLIVVKLLQGALGYYFQTKYLNDTDEGRVSIMRNLLLFIRMLIWISAGLFIVDNLGFDITAMVAGFGIGGMAIALASQNILADIFSYFTIFFDKPFQVGDFVTVQGHSGTVEHIGLKTTRIRSSHGEQLVFGNGDLIKNCIQNYKKMQRRRIVTAIGVTYETAPEKLHNIPKLIGTILEPKSNISVDRIHFKSFGDSSLNFEFVYYVNSSSYVEYMDIQQTINYELFDTFAAQSIDFAYPTQTLFVNQTT